MGLARVHGFQDRSFWRRGLYPALPGRFAVTSRVKPCRHSLEPRGMNSIDSRDRPSNPLKRQINRTVCDHKSGGTSDDWAWAWHADGQLVGRLHLVGLPQVLVAVNLGWADTMAESQLLFPAQHAAAHQPALVGSPARGPVGWENEALGVTVMDASTQSPALHWRELGGLPADAHPRVPACTSRMRA